MPSAPAAPPVCYPVQRSLWLAGALICVAALGGAAVLAWAVQGARTPAHGLQLAAAAALWCAACAIAGRFWARGVCGVLAWNGQTWTLQAQNHTAVVAGELAVRLDLQAHLWLRWQGGSGAVHWLWLEQRSDRARWGDLRRAVYSRAGTLAADAAHPAAQRDPSG